MNAPGTQPPPEQPPEEGRFLRALMRLGLLLLITLGVLAIFYEGAREAKSLAPADAGKIAPALKAERAGGGDVALTDFKGQVVLVDFWATWCPPCTQELPVLVRLTQQLEARGVVLLAANRIATDSKEDVRLFVTQRVPQPLPTNVHIAFAGEDVMEQYKIQALPTLYVIDRGGRIANVMVGFSSEAELRSRVEKVLAL